MSSHTKEELEEKIRRYKVTIGAGLISGTILEWVKQKLRDSESELYALTTTGSVSPFGVEQEPIIIHSKRQGFLLCEPKIKGEFWMSVQHGDSGHYVAKFKKEVLLMELDCATGSRETFPKRPQDVVEIIRECKLQLPNEVQVFIDEIYGFR